MADSTSSNRKLLPTAGHDCRFSAIVGHASQEASPFGESSGRRLLNTLRGYAGEWIRRRLLHRGPPPQSESGCCGNVVPVQSGRLYSVWRPPERRYESPTLADGGQSRLGGVADSVLVSA